jgi:hypothetical protein
VFAAERKFDFSEVPENETPGDFRSVITARGKPGEWKVRKRKFHRSSLRS